jgi:hypothetical protein
MITIQKANTILKSTTRILPSTPRTLFRNGEEGAIIDASRAETAFDDTAGTTPATYGGSVARVDDIGPNGRNAVQSSSSLRPLLGRAPVAGRRNLLRATEQFQSVWGSTGLTGDGMSIRETTANTSRRLEQSIGSVLAADTYTVSMDILGVNTTECLVWLFTASANSVRSTVNLVAGTISAQGVVGGVLTGATAELLDDGYVRIRLSGQRGANGSGALLIYTRNNTGAYSGDTTVGLDIRSIQVEKNSTATPYQRVGSSALDVTEAGLPAPGYLRFDLVDDTMPVEFPPGFDGDILIFGRSGSWVQEGVTVAAGGTLTIGPTAVPGAPTGLLRALGDIVGWLPVGRTTTQAERNRMRDYYMARGAKGFLVEGPELITNGDFSTAANTTGWSHQDGAGIVQSPQNISITGGRLRLTSNGAYLQSALQPLSGIATSRRHIVRLGQRFVPSGRNASATIRQQVGAGDLYFNATSSFADAPPVTQIASIGTSVPFVRLSSVFAAAGEFVEFEGISVKELRPEEEW